ncbi:MAG: xylan 1,4-beta-xylosidase [Agathobacter sp.]|nr:xylan 1,4-beta-xylosidase [Agathobacter sp.]
MAKEKRFEEVYTQGVMNTINIWVDNQTGVNYLVYSNGSGCGMTPLLDSTGNVVVTPVSRRNYD